MIEINTQDTALLITDPQNDFLSPEGATWDLVGESVMENRTVENIEALLKAAKQNGIQVFISPHYYYPTDHGWKFEGTLEKVMHDINMFDRKGPLDLEDFEGSGADWLEIYKPYINDGQTVVASPHKVYGPENNDLILQLRKRGIGRLVLCGMSANLCVESHLRELLEQGFEVMVVSDDPLNLGTTSLSPTRWSRLRRPSRRLNKPAARTRRPAPAEVLDSLVQWATWPARNGEGPLAKSSPEGVRSWEKIPPR